MFPTFEQKDPKRKRLGRLLHYITNKPVVLSDPETWKNVEDHDFFEFPSDDDELLDPSNVTKTLYERMVKDCLEGEVFPPDPDFSYEEIRQKAIRTHINNIIAISTTTVGAADLTRKDKSLFHKKVIFPSANPIKPGKPSKPVSAFSIWMKQQLRANNLDDEDSSDSGTSFKTAQESTDSEASFKTAQSQVQAAAPNIVEKFMLCQCRRHEHCLTCRMTPVTFNLVVRESYKDISQSESTRWVLALRSLDRSFQIWTGEHVKYLVYPTTIAKGNKTQQEWQTPVDSLDEASLTCIKDMINLSYGISYLRGKRCRYFCNSIRKMVKISSGFNATIAKIALAGSDATAKKMQEKCIKFKAAIETCIQRALEMLDKLETGLLLFMHGRLRTLRDDILENFELTNSTWPASSVRKITFMNEVLIGVYGDSQTLVPKIKVMHAVWKQPAGCGEIFAWSETVQGHIKFWGEWHDEAKKGLEPLTAWAEVSDRGQEDCTEVHRKRPARV